MGMRNIIQLQVFTWIPLCEVKWFFLHTRQIPHGVEHFLKVYSQDESDLLGGGYSRFF